MSNMASARNTKNLTLSWDFKNAMLPFKKVDPLQEELTSMFKNFVIKHDEIEKKKRQMRMTEYYFQKS